MLGKVRGTGEEWVRAREKLINIACHPLTRRAALSSALSHSHHHQQHQQHHRRRRHRFSSPSINQSMHQLNSSRLLPTPLPADKSHARLTCGVGWTSFLNISCSWTGFTADLHSSSPGPRPASTSQPTLAARRRTDFVPAGGAVLVPSRHCTQLPGVRSPARLRLYNLNVRRRLRSSSIGLYPGSCCICLEQSAGESVRSPPSLTVFFAVDWRPSFFCSVVLQLFWLSPPTMHRLLCDSFFTVTCPRSLRSTCHVKGNSFIIISSRAAVTCGLAARLVQ